MSEAKIGDRNPNYGKTPSEETKRKLSEAKLGLKFFNDGTRNVRARECPEGFVPGMLRKSA
jgi:hypothetical protein